MGYLENNNIVYNKEDTYIPYIVNNYSRKEVLLEIGAGISSTRVFSEYFDKMYSVENNKAFENKYNSNYIHIDLESKTGWYNQEDFKNNIPKDYDLIFLDGPQGGHNPPFQDKRPFRYGFCSLNWESIKKDVTIIVDDIYRDWREREVVKFLKEHGYSCTDHEKFAVCEPPK